MPDPLYKSVLNCLMQTDPGLKVAATRELLVNWRTGNVFMDLDTVVARIEVPGRPDQPELVSPRAVPKRGFNSVIGRVRMAHAIAHIEFNAINLALDAAYRFRNMPDLYYADWLQVAAEEALHFSLLEGYLHSQQSYYGAHAAHNGLWEMALKTDHDLITRMALVPRVLEARGLDVTQSMIARLNQEGDTALVEILQTIYHDEIGHVEIGSRWFKYVCEINKIDSETTFSRLLTEYKQATLTGPMDELARTRAGFTKGELDFLAGRNQPD